MNWFCYSIIFNFNLLKPYIQVIYSFILLLQEDLEEEVANEAAGGGEPITSQPQQGPGSTNPFR